MKTLNKIHLLALVGCLLGASAFAGDTGGGSTGGGGIAEQSFTFAYLNIGKYLGLCLTTKKCALTEAEETLLSKVTKSLSQELPRLSFASAQSEPRLFSDKTRVASTGSAVGSEIHVNTDLLYAIDGNKKTITYDVPAAVAVLTHELGHHHGVSNHGDLDLLGSKVRSLLESRIQRTQWENVEMMAIPLESSVELLVTDGGTLKDYGPKVQEKLRCPYQGTKLKSFSVNNLHWETSSQGHHSYFPRLHAKAFLDFVCITPDGKNRRAHGYDALITIAFFSESQVLGGLRFSRNDSNDEVKVDSSNVYRVDIVGSLVGTAVEYTEFTRQSELVRMFVGDYALVLDISHSPMAQVHRRSKDGLWSYDGETLTESSSDGAWNVLTPIPESSVRRSRFKVRVARYNE